MGEQKHDIAGTIGAAPYCRTCGSERVVRDAWASWNAETGLWELQNVFDQEFCEACEAATSFDWKQVEAVGRAVVRDLNDRFRQFGQGNGMPVCTVGVRERGDDFTLKAVEAVQAFSDFSEENDPWGEHDFGAVEIDGEKLFWKIDYYDRSLTMHSPNPANDGVTRRVLTIMLAAES